MAVVAVPGRAVVQRSTAACTLFSGSSATVSGGKRRTVERRTGTDRLSGAGRIVELVTAMHP
jgi:hypothetical protein